MAIQNRKQSTKVIVTGLKVISEEYTLRKARTAANLFQRKHGIEPDSIGGRKVIGHCHRSGTIILEGDDWERIPGDHGVDWYLVKENNDFRKPDRRPHHD